MEDAKIAEIGHRLYTRRKELGFTQEQIAELAGLHNVTISNIELGKREPELDTYIKLCVTLKISLDFAFTGKEYPYTFDENINRIAHKIGHMTDKQRHALEVLIDSFEK